VSWGQIRQCLLRPLWLTVRDPVEDAEDLISLSRLLARRWVQDEDGLLRRGWIDLDFGLELRFLDLCGLVANSKGERRVVQVWGMALRRWAVGRLSHLVSQF